MSNSQVVQIEPLRSVGHASITGSYTALGTALAYPCRLMCITNTTDADMLFSLDGSTDMLIVPKTSFKLFDLCTNRYNRDQYFVLAGDTQVFVKYSSSPSSGSVYLECLYASSSLSIPDGY